MTRRANEYGCYVYPVYKSKLDLEPKLLYAGYITAAINAVARRSRNDLDRKVSEIMALNEGFYEKLQDGLYAEDPANQMAVADYIF